MSASGSQPDPYAEEVVRPAIVELVRSEMAGTWREDDELLTRFFSEDPTRASSYQAARKELYNDKKHIQRWKGIPSSPKTVSALYTPLTNLMNGILSHYGFDRDKRLILNTHGQARLKAAGPDNVVPGIYLAGVGPEFASTPAQLPRATFASGISAFEIMLNDDDMLEARERLAVHMKRIFDNQFNRRFAFGVVLTEHTFTVYMFDRSGVLISEPCAYHYEPERFCALLYGLASDKERIGFDCSMSCLEGRARIRTHESTDDGAEAGREYIVRGTLFRAPQLVGRGTICWLTKGPDGAAYVIKDAWITQSELLGRESEGSLLRHAQAQGVRLGVAQIHHFEDVRLSTDPSDLDTVLRNRRMKDASPEERGIECVHTRMVMTTHGKTLDKFSTRMELLLAFYDAVQAHRRLYDVAGILHRDISVRNILIHSDGVEGDRGILIDFDHAIRVADTSPYSTKKRIGTWRFMSRKVLDARDPHTYLDDLESFYYVLCWILVAYERPGTGKVELPTFISVWDLPGASDFKMGLWVQDFRQPVAPWFGDSLHHLIIRLHQFFQRRFRPTDEPTPSLDPTADYDEFLSHVRQGITDLGKETLPEEEHLLSLGHTPSDPGSAPKPEPRKRKRRRDKDESPAISPTSELRKPEIALFLQQRPRRTKHRNNTHCKPS